VSRFLETLAVLAVFSTPCIADETDNVEVVKAMTEAINNRDLKALDAFVSTDVVRHSASTPGLIVTSLDEFRAFLETDFASIPDSVQTIDIIFGSGDFVAVRARYAGTQTGPMGPFPASGNKMELPYMGILRFEDAKIVEIWVEWDNVHALTQLGHFPPPVDGAAQTE
jgi:predicted ester cyclase